MKQPAKVRKNAHMAKPVPLKLFVAIKLEIKLGAERVYVIFSLKLFVKIKLGIKLGTE